MAGRGGLRIRPPYGASCALAQWAVAHWTEYNGYCIDRGIRPLALSGADLLDHIYFFLIKGADRKQRDEIDRVLANNALLHASPGVPAAKKAVRIPSEAEMYASSMKVAAWAAKN